MAYLALVLLGLCFGSFVNAYVWRIHKQRNVQSKKSKTTKNSKNYSIINGRSMCVDCEHELSAKDLIPLFSWLSLGGKCRYCKKPISPQYPIVELLTAILFVCAYQFWDYSTNTSGLAQFMIFSSFMIGIVIGLSLAIYDFRWKILPNSLVGGLSLVGLFFAALNIFSQTNSFGPRFIDLVLAIAISSGIFWILFQVSNGKWIGGGDVKLGFALGFFLLTPINSFLMIFLASLLGSLYALLLKLLNRYKRQMHIPFGPFLLMATYMIVIFGSQIIDIYKDLLYL